MKNNQDYSKLKLGNYNRKSSEAEDRQILSIESQIQENFLIAKSYDLPSFIKIFQESKSAKTEYSRKEFSEMMSCIDRGTIDSIVCWSIDRLARNMTEGGKIIDYLSKGKIKAIFTKDKVWLPSDNVILMAVHFSQSTQYSKDLSDNVKRGQRNKARLQGYPSGLASIGFLNSKQGEKGERWWYVDEERFWKVKKLFELFLTGKYSIGKLHKVASEELKLNTPPHKKLGNKIVTKEYIAKMLHNPVFAGYFFVQDERYALNVNLPRVVRESEFNKIQNILSNRHKGKMQSHKATYADFIHSETGDFIGQDIKYQMWCDCKHKFAFRDKKCCPKCNKKIEELQSPEYFIQSYYYNVKKKKARLKYKSISEDSITNELVRYGLKNFIIPQSLINWSKKFIKEVGDEEIKQSLEMSKSREVRKLDYKSKRDKVITKFIEDQISPSEKEAYLVKLEKEYIDLKIEDNVSLNWVSKMDKITDLVKSFEDTVLNGTYEERRDLLNTLGSNMTWNDENLTIRNKKSVDSIFKGLKSIETNIEKFGKENILTSKDFMLDFEGDRISVRKW